MKWLAENIKVILLSLRSWGHLWWKLLNAFLSTDPERKRLDGLGLHPTDRLCKDLALAAIIASLQMDN